MTAQIDAKQIKNLPPSSGGGAPTIVPGDSVFTVPTQTAIRCDVPPDIHGVVEIYGVLILA